MSGGVRIIRLRGVGVGLFAVAVLMLGGCAGKGDITGTVSRQGKPLKFGTVQFQSAEGTLYAADIQADGTYSVKNVPSGTAKVLVTAYDPRLIDYAKQASAAARGATKGGKSAPSLQGNPDTFNMVPDKYGEFATSGLTVEIKSGQNTYNIDIPD